MTGIIGGSGLYKIPGLAFIEEIKLDSKYGAPSDAYLHYKHRDVSFYFLCRHGRSHSLAPHMINYRANIDGFAKLGVKQIVSFSATGGIAENLKPGDIVIPDNAIDNTSGRQGTYYDTENIVHIDFTNPFCPELRRHIINNLNVPHRPSGVSICTNGPRLETAAEIRAYRNWGADIVGMTLFPECVLARELGICYANVSVVTNYAAGICDKPLTTDEVQEVMGRSAGIFSGIITDLAAFTPGGCGCGRSLENTEMKPSRTRREISNAD